MVIRKLTDIPLDADLVLLDMDNTLYDYRYCHEIATQAMLKKWSERIGSDTKKFQEAYRQSREEVKKKHPDKAISHSRFFYSQGAVEAIFNTTDAQLVMELYAAYWDNFIQAMSLHEDVIPFLKACKTKNIPVVLVTDMTAFVQFRKVIHLGINSYLSFIVTSEEAGVEKPAEAIYLLAVEKAKKVKDKIERIIVTGDDDSRDTLITDKFQVLNYYIGRQ